MKMKVKYLKSEQDDTAQDNLLKLPRVNWTNPSNPFSIKSDWKND